MAVDELVGILISVPIKESATISMICDDALGGFTMIDPRKFAANFIKYRRADLDGGPGSWSGPPANVTTGKNNDGWTNIPQTRPTQAAAPFVLESLNGQNQFAAVGAKKKNKNKNKAK